MAATTLVSAQAVAGTGDWVKVRKINEKRTFQVTITGTASVSIEASNDGSNAIPLRSGITASSGYEDDAPWEWVRMKSATIGSGTVTVVMGERE